MEVSSGSTAPRLLVAKRPGAYFTPLGSLVIVTAGSGFGGFAAFAADRFPSSEPGPSPCRV